MRAIRPRIIWNFKNIGGYLFEFKNDAGINLSGSLSSPYYKAERIREAARRTGRTEKDMSQRIDQLKDGEALDVSTRSGRRR